MEGPRDVCMHVFRDKMGRANASFILKGCIESVSHQWLPFFFADCFPAGENISLMCAFLLAAERRARGSEDLVPRVGLHESDAELPAQNKHSYDDTTLT